MDLQSALTDAPYDAQPSIADIGGLLQPWLTPQNIILAVFSIAVLSLAINLVLTLQKKRLNSEALKNDDSIKKLQTQLREDHTRLEADERRIKAQEQFIEKQRKTIESGPIADGMKIARQGANVTDRYWERIDKVGGPGDDPNLDKLVLERDDINSLIELTKIKYHTRAIDEKSFSNITEGYQKKLIEIESKIKRQTAALEPAAGKDTQAKAAPWAVTAGRQQQAMLQSKMGGMGDASVMLVSTKSENDTLVVSTILDILLRQRNMGGVYICVSRPQESISALLAASGLSSEDVYFIDCISRMAGKNTSVPEKNVVFVDNPSSLEEVSMYLDRGLQSISKRKFIFLDSLSSMLIYNSNKSVKEFTHFIINRMRLDGIAGIILSIEKKEAEDLVNTLSPMCDQQLKF
ncbi:MAG: hypothetical protein V1875_05555 [Candidatus Altiarchaeota archaeon]